MLTVCDSTDRSECHHMGVMEGKHLGFPWDEKKTTREAMEMCVKAC